jgi:N-acyl-D-aspartate/D-glutamate deacylase
MALDGRTVPLPEAIRKMTSLPAARFGLTDRGTIRKGMRADIVVFNPSTVRDAATCVDPHRFAEGIDHVLVNGVPTVEDGELTNRRAGQFL